MDKEIKKYLEEELKYYTEKLERELRKLNYLIINFKEEDIAIENCYKDIKYIGNKIRKILKLLKKENKK